MSNDLGENIAALRKQRGVKQDDLAKYVCVSAQAVYTFRPNIAFVPFLIFARDMINPPCRFMYRWLPRKKPYLNEKN